MSEKRKEYMCGSKNLASILFLIKKFYFMEDSIVVESNIIENNVVISFFPNKPY